MSYPSAPWTLKGNAVQTLHLVNIDRVRPLVPSELNIISVWPGKTIGGVYLSKYGSGSVLEYNELIVAPAVVIYQGEIGVWVSHIYVDNADSVAGGREIWGLPKELADFTWEEKRVTVRQGNVLLCNLNYNQQRLGWRQRLGAASFSRMGNNLLRFDFEFEAGLGLVGSKLEVGADSPFAGIGLNQPFATVDCEQMTLRVDAPTVVGEGTVN
ncbi:acetoacetate decarboxylase family protein [Nodularia sp. UHCC 0506]|uniref:acetoacetate decarboxylase family protein n=1 Tax=Nodularia sp. UHCC 0506 TaxID=3110243 RepID=UPI002B20CE4E|nr:acetoacetate decarboxylase family protein [Nodularia sp. UHCC 0506]MEA5514268.1 acetoacetate decarboxylase family protein [Nodularia sp. UHCC 0506]